MIGGSRIAYLAERQQYANSYDADLGLTALI